MNIGLDSYRNKLMRINLHLSMGMMGLGGGTLIAGLFGKADERERVCVCELHTKKGKNSKFFTIIFTLSLVYFFLILYFLL